MAWNRSVSWATPLSGAPDWGEVTKDNGLKRTPEERGESQGENGQHVPRPGRSGRFEGSVAGVRGGREEPENVPVIGGPRVGGYQDTCGWARPRPRAAF